MPVRKSSIENSLFFERLATLALTALVTLSWVDSLPAEVSGVNAALKVCRATSGAEKHKATAMAVARN